MALVRLGPRGEGGELIGCGKQAPCVQIGAARKSGVVPIVIMPSAPRSGPTARYGCASFNCALGLAPRSSKSFTASGSPAAEACMSAVVPRELAEFGFAPAFSNKSTMGAFPLMAAMNSGVNRSTRVTAAAFAPAWRRIRVMSTSFLYAAQCRAVIPSPWPTTEEDTTAA